MAIAAFPKVKPSSRGWTPGSPPMRSFGTLSGYQARVLLGDKPVGTSLSLGFQNIQESVFLLIMDHYIAAKGSYDTFALPAEVFAGMQSSSKVTSSGFTWRYASAPTVTWVKAGIGNVSVQLSSVPI